VPYNRKCITQSDVPRAARVRVPVAERKRARRRARERARTQRQTRLSCPSRTLRRARALVGAPIAFAVASRRERGVERWHKQAMCVSVHISVSRRAMREMEGGETAEDAPRARRGGRAQR
jgi:hypothetical protein